MSQESSHSATTGRMSVDKSATERQTINIVCDKLVKIDMHLAGRVIRRERIMAALSKRTRREDFNSYHAFVYHPRLFACLRFEWIHLSTFTHYSDISARAGVYKDILANA
jgi:hypothetical protein